jgi:hypothetical protein
MIAKTKEPASAAGGSMPLVETIIAKMPIDDAEP